MPSQPYGFPCKGGLNKTLSKFDLLAQPGLAAELINYEVKPDGGYRRINGYEPFGGVSATRPNGENTILGLVPYALGLICCVGDGVFYSEDGITWLQVNKDTTHAGLVEADMAAATELPRSLQGKASFKIMKAAKDHTTNPYGSLTIATGGDPMGHFHIDGTGATRKFVYEEVSGAGAPAAAKHIEVHNKHLCVIDTTNTPSTVTVSATDSDTDFASAGSEVYTIPDRIVGIKSFRASLYIFCENSIYKLDNINDTATAAITQVTGNVGCVSSQSIQEIGGDLIFLAPDGFRQIAGTERIGDVELSSVSRAIQVLVEPLTSNISQYVISSTVIRDKSQYRFFYNVNGANAVEARGFIGTLTAEGFQWSEIHQMEVASVTSEFDEVGEEVYYHGDHDGYIYLHDSGPDFNGGNILSSYETPYLDFGDLGTLKTIKAVEMSITPEGAVSPTLRVRYDYGSSSSPQPSDYELTTIDAPTLMGTAVFGTDIFGGAVDPMVRQSVEGSGHTSSYRLKSENTKPPYTINGLYINYDPSGRR